MMGKDFDDLAAIARERGIGLRQAAQLLDSPGGQ